MTLQNIPAWAKEKHPLPKMNRLVETLEDPRLIRKKFPEIDSAQAVKNRDKALAQTTLWKKEASRRRNKAAEKFGKKKGLNPFPMSGGTCEHWPRETKDHVLAAVHNHQDWEQLAHTYHKTAGKRVSTIRPLIDATE